MIAEQGRARHLRGSLPSPSPHGAEAILALAERIDGLAPPPRGEQIVLLFHRLFGAAELGALAGVYPHECLRLDQFCAVLDWLRGRGFGFCFASELGARLAAGERVAAVTFDDGYADNLRVLPILERHGVPATIFVCPGPIIDREGFWWDVVFREEHVRGGRAGAAIGRMLPLPADAIRREIVRRYGAGALGRRPTASLPMTVHQLRQLAASPWIEIGNHTYDHSILCGRTRDYVEAQLGSAQEALRPILGYSPRIMSYPNGRYDQVAVETVGRMGFALGFTTDRRYLDPRRAEPFELPRHTISGRRAIDRQLASALAPRSVARLLYRLRARLR